MTPDDVEAMLQATLEDRRLSRGERRALQQVFSDAMVFDGTQLVTGSSNWTRAAAKHNQEDLIVTNDIRLVRAFREAFEALWEQFHELYAVR